LAVYSGLPFAASLPDELRDVPWPEKPVPRKKLIQVIAGFGRPVA
jgi:hypothetical protein